MFEFNFETSSSGPNPKFTVFIKQENRGTVRQGDVFSEDERLAVYYDLLKDNDDQPHGKDWAYDKGDVLVHDDKQRRFHIRFEAHTQVIGHHELIRINVDALEDGFSAHNPDRTWLWVDTKPGTGHRHVMTIL
ncbi:uncharacterized protein J4E79_011509 [Alternaria viburni]|uniref:uncharacterized protein n=1 Tax=Alternaria viburni TaxID=566460 RepID=UPI0020C2BBD5|nr:uncharacterized protein J4E79_011509 [Alternaria viburni]KAI4642447.1 hypothetical protein J4E79_011509 [Alternaria viburni]